MEAGKVQLEGSPVMDIRKILSNIFVSIDQFGNALAGGNPDNTISARVGYYTEKRKNEEEKIAIVWEYFRKIIDITFFPIDGKNHCKKSYYNDAGEEFDKETSDVAIALLAIVIVPSCLPIGTLLYTLHLFGLIKPIEDDINKRSEKIIKRLRLAKAKLNGLLWELNDYENIDVNIGVNAAMKKELKETEAILNKVSEKIKFLEKIKKD